MKTVINLSHLDGDDSKIEEALKKVDCFFLKDCNKKTCSEYFPRCHQFKTYNTALRIIHEGASIAVNYGVR